MTRLPVAITLLLVALVLLAALGGCSVRNCEVRWGTEGFPAEGGPRK